MNKIQNRRDKAKSRLEKQLQTGMKNTRQGKVELSDQDKVRINKEILILTK
jgi:hypothetical protein